MTPIRRLNKKGIEIFRAYINEINDGKKDPPPLPILCDKNFSTTFDSVIEIDGIRFSTRLDAAKYFSKLFSGLNPQRVSSDVGTWSWLSLFFFDQVCPADRTGLRNPGREYRHILEPGYPYGHRHLLGGAYLVYEVFGLGDEYSRLLLSTPLHSESPFHHQLSSRLNFITNKAVMEAAYVLYFDAEKSTPKKGSLSRKNPGNLFRFIDVLQQFELTYDLFSMTGNQILRLLPPEFKNWIS